jgi:hypothetical protein
MLMNYLSDVVSMIIPFYGVAPVLEDSECNHNHAKIKDTPTHRLGITPQSHCPCGFRQIKKIDGLWVNPRWGLLLGLLKYNWVCFHGSSS